jgi:hypothetical protein
MALDDFRYGICGKRVQKAATPNRAEFLNALLKTLSVEEHFYLTQDEWVMSQLGYLTRGCVPAFTIANLKGYIASNDHAIVEGRHRKIYLSGIEKALQKVADAMARYGVEEIDVSDVRAAAKKTWGKRKGDATIGELYFVVSHEAAGELGEPIVEAVALSPYVQVQVRSLFHNVKGSTPTQRELGELKAIVNAGVLFEQNTFLKDDIGGWLGNFRRSMKNGTRLTRCGSEAITYELFISALEAAGLLKFTGVHTDGTVIRTGRFTAHQAVLLVGKQTSELYVFDSWLADGGEPAHVVKKSDWYRGDYDRSVFATTE